MNVFEKIASEINEERKHKGKKVSITPQMVEETIENTWNEARKNRLSTSAQNVNIDQKIPINEELYSPVPTEQSLSQKIEDIDNQSRLALSEAKNAVSHANKAQQKNGNGIVGYWHDLLSQLLSPFYDGYIPLLSLCKEQLILFIKKVLN